MGRPDRRFEMDAFRFISEIISKFAPAEKPPPNGSSQLSRSQKRIGVMLWSPVITSVPAFKLPEIILHSIERD